LGGGLGSIDGGSFDFLFSLASFSLILFSSIFSAMKCLPYIAS